VALLSSVSIFSFIIAFLFSDLFSSASRFSTVHSSFKSVVYSIIKSPVGKFVLTLLLTALIIANSTGNLPHSTVFSMFYSVVLSLSLIFWLPLIITTFKSQFKTFTAHLLPYGSPYPLFILLPVIELFSLTIRPFTLVIRLSTNLAAGHIMMFIFSYFTTLSTIMVPLLFVSLL
jgi:F0F1-type ATP synthase membrane subunit a